MKKQLYKLLSIGGLIWLTSHVAQAQTCASPATSNSPQCVGSSLNLSAPVGGSSYSWTGPNGFSSTQQNPVISKVQVIASGIYSVRRTLFLATCTATVSVVINAKPVVSALSNSPVCVGVTVNLSATGGIAYTWAGPEAFSSILQNPTRTNASVTMSGIYTVTVQNAANCTSSATTNVVVNTNPIATVSSNSPVCVGASINLSALGGTTYSWAGPGGFTTTLQNPTRTNASVTMSGIYTVKVQNAANCTSSATTNVVVNTNPVATVSSNSPVCVGASINLSALGGTTYSWAGPGGFTTTLQNPTRTNASVTMSGTYTVTVQNATNCTSSATTNTNFKVCVRKYKGTKLT